MGVSRNDRTLLAGPAYGAILPIQFSEFSLATTDTATFFQDGSIMASWYVPADFQVDRVDYFLATSPTNGGSVRLGWSSAAGSATGITHLHGSLSINELFRFISEDSDADAGWLASDLKVPAGNYMHIQALSDGTGEFTNINAKVYGYFTGAIGGKVL